MKKTAIIGANGFFGQRLLQAFDQAGHRVTAVYNRSKENIPDKFESVSFDELLKQNLPLDNLVFAAGSFTNTHQQLIDINCKALLSLREQYADARIVYISSTNVYGLQAGVIREDSPFSNPSLYGKAKIAGEFIVSAAKSYAIVRLAYLYGPGLQNNSFIPIILSQARQHNSITLMGKGEREQDYLYVDDAASLCVKAAAVQQNGVFLGATGKSLSNYAVAEHICSNLDGCDITFKGEEKGVSFYFDPTETFSRLDWQPQLSFAEGIKKCL